MSQSLEFTPPLSLPQYLERAQGLLLLAVLFATPLLMTTLTYEQFVWPKVAWVTLLTGGLTLLTLAKMLCGGTGRVALHFVNLGMALFFMWHLLLWPL
ncbi:TPA: hypothetical protein DDW35_03100, partial [Candidatus Sumerlaeota bacterium]|nr:hypothetical protein [Candidatus Sumerlaeota bacterium]